MRSALRSARWGYHGLYFLAARGARCENKINYYIARRVRSSANEQFRNVCTRIVAV
jgi:hypothetical protein